MTTPRAAAPGDVRVAVVENASNVANGNGNGNSAVPYQTVEEYEGNPDAQKPGLGNGIQISLDGLGAIIPLGRNYQSRADEKKAASVRRDVEAGTKALGKLSGGANEKNKVLLSDVRYFVFLNVFVFSLPLVVGKKNPGLPALTCLSPRPHTRTGDGDDLLGRHVRRHGPQRRGQDDAS